MDEVKNIGRHTYERLTDEEARREFGSSFVFVGQAKPPARPPQGAAIKLKTDAKKSKRNPK
jgi:hypothetical protein